MRNHYRNDCAVHIRIDNDNIELKYFLKPRSVEIEMMNEIFTKVKVDHAHGFYTLSTTINIYFL